MREYFISSLTHQHATSFRLSIGYPLHSRPCRRSNKWVKLLRLRLIRNRSLFSLAGRGGSRSSSYRGTRSNRTGSGSSCDDDCTDIIIGVVCGVVGLILIIVAIVVFRRCHNKSRVRSTPWRSNTTYVKYALPSRSGSGVQDFIFKSGSWNCRYYRQYTWCGPYNLFLTFDAATSTVRGTGADSEGNYEIEGIYSEKTRRMGLTQRHTPASSMTMTPDGVHKIIQLAWDGDNKKFKGKWYDSSSFFKNDGDFELQLDSGGSYGGSEKHWDVYFSFSRTVQWIRFTQNQHIVGISIERLASIEKSVWWEGERNIFFSRWSLKNCQQHAKVFSSSSIVVIYFLEFSIICMPYLFH